MWGFRMLNPFVVFDPYDHVIFILNLVFVLL